MAKQEFVYTTAIDKLRKLNKRIRVIPGGTSAGKTFGILPILIDQAAREAYTEISVVSESIPHLKRGAMKDFEKIMRITGRWREENFNKTDRIYTFINKSKIEFFSADDEGRARGARRNVLYVNECNNIQFNTYYQLAIRTSDEIWLDFNPSNEFWVHEELSGDPDTEWLTLTYLDNEAAPPNVVAEIEKNREKALTSSYWANWYKVYGLGQLGSLEGVVFTNWTQLQALPVEASLLGYALDFGYANDPAALLAAYRWNGSIIWHELIYETGLTNKDLAKRMDLLRVKKDMDIIADSAEPKSIAELVQYGYRVRGAVKGRDSIMFGIDVMQQEPFYVTQDSVNTIKELRVFAWDTDKTGKVLNKPVGINDHSISAMRYFSTAKLSRQKSRKRGIRRRN